MAEKLSLTRSLRTQEGHRAAIGRAMDRNPCLHSIQRVFGSAEEHTMSPERRGRPHINDLRHFTHENID